MKEDEFIEWMLEMRKVKIKVVEELRRENERLREEVKVLSKYRDIVIEYDDALLADGDTDIRWSAIYEGD